MKCEKEEKNKNSFHMAKKVDEKKNYCYSMYECINIFSEFYTHIHKPLKPQKNYSNHKCQWTTKKSVCGNLRCCYLPRFWLLVSVSIIRFLISCSVSTFIRFYCKCSSGFIMYKGCLRSLDSFNSFSFCAKGYSCPK